MELPVTGPVWQLDLILWSHKKLKLISDNPSFPLLAF